MAAELQVRVPDIGDFADVDVIEVLVAPGDRVAVEQSLVTLESEKATMEIPSPYAGVVKELLVAVGDKVREGSALATIAVEESAATGKLAVPAAKAARQSSPLSPPGTPPLPAPRSWCWRSCGAEPTSSR